MENVGTLEVALLDVVGDQRDHGPVSNGDDRPPDVVALDSALEASTGEEVTWDDALGQDRIAA